MRVFLARWGPLDKGAAFNRKCFAALRMTDRRPTRSANLSIRVRERLEALAMNGTGAADNDEGRRIELVDQRFQPGYLGAGDNAEQKLTLLPGIAAPPGDPGYPALQLGEETAVDPRRA